jgi:tetratricopeptide (TPR) repeat protein
MHGYSTETGRNSGVRPSSSRGHLQEALGFLRQIETRAAAGGLPQTAAEMRLRMVRYEALCGLDTQALARVAEETRRGLTPTLRIDAVKVAVSAGEFALAARLLDQAEQESPAGTGQPDATFVRAYRAAIEAANGRTDRALALLTPLEPADLGIAYGFIPLFERARAHERAGNWAMARAAFEKILSHPTIDSGRTLIPLAQLRLARTLARQGDIAASRRAYEQFFERWKTAAAHPQITTRPAASRRPGAVLLLSRRSSAGCRDGRSTTWTASR